MEEKIEELKKRETELEVDLKAADEQAGKKIMTRFNMLKAALAKKYPQFNIG